MALRCKSINAGDRILNLEKVLSGIGKAENYCNTAEIFPVTDIFCKYQNPWS